MKCSKFDRMKVTVERVSLNGGDDSLTLNETYTIPFRTLMENEAVSECDDGKYEVSESALEVLIKDMVERCHSDLNVDAYGAAYTCSCEVTDDTTLPDERVNEMETLLRGAQDLVEQAAQIICGTRGEVASGIWHWLDAVAEEIGDMANHLWRVRQ